MIVPTSIKMVNDSFGGGFGAGELTVVAGRPSHGKSCFAFDYLDHAASLGHRTLLLSLEMSWREYSKRTVSRVMGREITTENSKENNKAIHSKLEDHFGSHAPMFFVEGCYHIDEIKEQTEKHVRDHGVTIVCLDYQNKARGGKGSRFEVHTEIVSQLKHMAKQYDIVLLDVAQMRRGDKATERPTLARLKDTGALEEEADNVLAVYYPYMEEPEKYTKEQMEIYNLKCRNRGIRIPQMNVIIDPTTQTYHELD